MPKLRLLVVKRTIPALRWFDRRNMSLNPAEKAFFENLAVTMQDKPPIDFSDITALRQSCRDFFPQYVLRPDPAIVYEEKSIKARDGYEIPIRIYNSDIQNAPIVFAFPGRGYNVDLFDENAVTFSRILKHANVKMMVVDYRVCPEYPLPIPMHDCFDVVEHVATHSDEYSIDPSQIIFVGLSSGAHAAAVISQLARETNTFSIKHQILLNGCYDMSQSHQEFREQEKEDGGGSRDNLVYMFDTWGVDKVDYQNPLFSPVFEPDVKTLPPTTIIVSEHDCIRSDSEAYFEHLKTGGARVEKIVLPGQTHNTILMRKVLSGGIDPSEVIATVINKVITEDKK